MQKHAGLAEVHTRLCPCQPHSAGVHSKSSSPEIFLGGELGKRALPTWFVLGGKGGTHPLLVSLKQMKGNIFRGKIKKFEDFTDK